MCNACGFYCCAYDGFSKCGCDHCPNPECWDEEDYDSEFGDDFDSAELHAEDMAREEAEKKSP